MPNFLENKCCFVRECKNTSVQVPNKVFITVPSNYSRKVNWFKAVGREVPSSKAKFYCCEDHFNLEEDMENYMRYKLMGGKIFLKTDVLPHIFDCKDDKSKSAAKRQRRLSPPVEEDIPNYVISKPIGDVKLIKYTSAAAPYKFRSKIEKKTEFTIVPGSAASNYNTKFPLVRDSLSSMGLKTEFMFIIDLIERNAHLTTASVFLTLQKIRLSQPFSELGEEYGLSHYHARNTFVRCAALIGQLMKEFIIWHPKEKIQALLPALFRADYGQVQCIINCFEVKIEKPNDAVKEDLTWSDDKQVNTLKYLISSTPDGLVNFISTAFGGKTSDAIVVEKSGFLDRLQPNTVIMADRGFQNIEDLLARKQCTLLRPPYEKQEIVMLNRQVISRLQEFKLLKPFFFISTELIPHLNSVTLIACGLINLQSLVKQ